MTLEYATRALVGTLTPQANTTAEPELNMLWPAGFSMITARLTSAKPLLEDRLADYYQHLDDTLLQFGNAPVQVVAAACTGSSYLIGTAREDALFTALGRRLGVPVTNSALAVVAALHSLQAKRIGLVSPYPKNLTAHSLTYWSSRGFEVAAVAEPEPIKEGFHPVYAMARPMIDTALLTLENTTGLDAIVLLGTGAPSLGTLLRHPRVAGAPVFSCNLALAWHSIELMAPEHSPRAANLLSMIGGQGWAEVFARRQI